MPVGSAGPAGSSAEGVVAEPDDPGIGHAVRLAAQVAHAGVGGQPGGRAGARGMPSYRGPAPGAGVPHRRRGGGRGPGARRGHRAAHGSGPPWRGRRAVLAGTRASGAHERGRPGRRPERFLEYRGAHRRPWCEGGPRAGGVGRGADGGAAGEAQQRRREQREKSTRHPPTVPHRPGPRAAPRGSTTPTGDRRVRGVTAAGPARWRAGQSRSCRSVALVSVFSQSVTSVSAGGFLSAS